MKKLFLVCLMMLAGSAWAEWTKIAVNRSSTFYIDLKTMRKDGDKRKVWIIQDLKARSERGILSIRAREEFDCTNDTRRSLSLTSHSEPMAEGETLSSTTFSTDSWKDIPPDSNSLIILEFVCAQ